jgi:nitrous oxide reductase accessory protein NosL
MTIRLLGWALLAAVILGCAPRVEGPPAIRYGESACTQCRMLISEARYAAARRPAGEAEVFDSVECLIQRLRAHPAEGPAWVHDYDSAAWLDARQAHYVRSAQLQTPMGGGLVALAEEQAAAELAQRVGGRVARFAELAAIP